jgi:PadR family transcriptional regulator PadR
MAAERLDLLQGTLDLLILRALQGEGRHGFGLSQRIREMSGGVFQVEMGSLYPALCRLEGQGWIRGAWGLSDANRRARYYSLTPAGRRKLRQETAKWETLSGAINLMLKPT